MARKLKTMEKDFWFNLNPAAEDIVKAEYFLDLAQVASLVNRVSLRQGMEYVVESVEVVTNGAANVSIFRIPEHWPAINAWEKAYHTWRKSQDQVLEDNESLKGKYHDFKVRFSSGHNPANNLIPVGYEISGGAGTDYDWDESQIQIPNDPASGTTTGYTLHMLGDKTATSMGIINGYAASRSRPNLEEPNIPHMDSWMIDAFDTGENFPEIITDLRYENDVAPYLIGEEGSSSEFYPGGEFQGVQDWTVGGMNPSYGTLETVLTVRAGDSAMAKDGAPGFVAPLGLLHVTVEADSLTDSPIGPFDLGQLPSLMLRVTLAPGGYKGLLAQRMQEAN